MHSVHLTPSTHFGLDWSCSKLCICVAWERFYPGSHNSWWPATTMLLHMPCAPMGPTLSSSGCMVSCTLGQISRGKCRGQHHVLRAAHVTASLFDPSVSTSVTAYHRGWGLSISRIWVTVRAPIPCKTWEVCNYLLIPVTRSHVTAWEIKNYIFFKAIYNFVQATQAYWPDWHPKMLTRMKSPTETVLSNRNELWQCGSRKEQQHFTNRQETVSY